MHSKKGRLEGGREVKECEYERECVSASGRGKRRNK